MNDADSDSSDDSPRALAGNNLSTKHTPSPFTPSPSSSSSAVAPKLTLHHNESAPANVGSTCHDNGTVERRPAASASQLTSPASGSVHGQQSQAPQHSRSSGVLPDLLPQTRTPPQERNNTGDEVSEALFSNKNNRSLYGLTRFDQIWFLNWVRYSRVGLHFVMW